MDPERIGTDLSSGRAASAMRHTPFGGWAISGEAETPGFASPPHGGFAFLGERCSSQTCIGKESSFSLARARRLLEKRRSDRGRDRFFLDPG